VVKGACVDQELHGKVQPPNLSLEVSLSLGDQISWAGLYLSNRVKALHVKTESSDRKGGRWDVNSLGRVSLCGILVSSWSRITAALVRTPEISRVLAFHVKTESRPLWRWTFHGFIDLVRIGIFDASARQGSRIY